MKRFQLASLCAAAVVSINAQAATHYAVTELPQLSVGAQEYDDVSAAGFDSKGRAYINVGGDRNGVRRSFGERCSDLGGCKQLPPKDLDPSWRSVAGDRAGGLVIDADGFYWAARLTRGSRLELLEPSAIITGITKSGLASGYKTDGAERPFFYDTELHLLPTLAEGRPARANAINSKGYVVGSAEHPQRSNSCAVAWKKGVLTVLQCPPEGGSALALGVNSLGHAVGSSTEVKSSSPHAVRFEGTKVVDLGAVGDPRLNFSLAYAINDSQVAVGYGSTPTNGMANAIVFHPVEGAFELATLVPQADRDKYYFQYAKSINNAGQILVEATRLADHAHVVLRLDPLPADR